MSLRRSSAEGHQRPMRDLGSEPGNVEADVTFSFASEVVRFDDDIHLEQDDLFMVTCRSAGGDVMWEYEMDAP